jgi:hypothetical protein
MKNATSLSLLVFAFVILGTAQIQSAKPLKFEPAQVQRVEILYFPERVLVREDFRPETLERLYRYKLEIRQARESAEWHSLLALLRETSVKPSGHSYDHRVAVLLFDQNDRRLASVYFAGSGGGGTIDGKSGTVTGGLYVWAKSLLKGIDE